MSVESEAILEKLFHWKMREFIDSLQQINPIFDVRFGRLGWFRRFGGSGTVPASISSQKLVDFAYDRLRAGCRTSHDTPAFYKDPYYS